MNDKPILGWKLSLAETLAFGCTVASVLIFTFGNFTSRSEAQALEKRIESLERQMHLMKDDISAIRASTEYIKGRLEPKFNKEQ